MQNKDELSARLRKLRVAAGLSLSQLAKLAGTSVPALSRYENGWRRFELQTVKKIVSALGYEMRIEFSPIIRKASVHGSAATRQLGRLFWDTPLRRSHFETNPEWVMGRVLEYGDLSDVHALIDFMGRSKFLETVARTRLQSARTRSLWQHVLKTEGFSKCTKKCCQEEASRSWPR